MQQSLSVLDDFIKTQDKGATDLWDDVFQIIPGSIASSSARCCRSHRQVAGHGAPIDAEQPSLCISFFSKRKDTVVDRTFVAPVLARKTREYIAEHLARTISPADQRPFIAYVGK